MRVCVGVRLWRHRYWQSSSHQQASGDHWVRM